ncbi:MAG: amino acid adenylation domain-containing protein [Anaerolineaceae bacterium]|nr:amino acid adenylation domain-containing protein [Anaerolineaceae bacterium]MCB9101587.1 amino acid adenylation domain-containing protein [Anaerolineales bacterium]
MTVEITNSTTKLTAAETKPYIEQGLKQETTIRADPVAPIPRRPPQESIPLSFAQEGIWYLEQLQLDQAAYNMPAAWFLHGSLNVAALEWAFNALIQRHETLRTSFQLIDNQPVQIIAPDLTLTLRTIDLQHLDNEAQEKQARQLVEADGVGPFDLTQAPLLRVTLLQLAAEKHILSLTMHHIISDAWSMDVLIQELSALYVTFIQQQSDANLSKLPIQYADFAVWQREQVQNKTLEKDPTYWRKQLTGAPPLLELPTDYIRPATQSYKGDSVEDRLPADLMRSLEQLSIQENASLFMTMLTAFYILLYRHTGQDDIVVGAPLINRRHIETEPLIGYFLNNLALRTPISASQSCAELLAAVRRTTLEAYSHQALPFEKLVQEVQPQRDLSYAPIFQVFFTMFTTVHNKGLALANLDATPFVNYETEIGSKFDITLSVRQDSDDVYLRLVYKTSLFRHERMETMLAQYVQLLRQITAQPNRPIAELSLVTPETRPLLPDPSAPLSDTWHGAVHTQFARMAQQQPHQHAIVDPQEIWSYQELEQRSNQLAHWLIAQGIRPGDVMAIYGHRNASLIWAWLGVLKAGGALVNLDPAYPTDRLLHYLTFAQAKGIIQIEAAGPLPDAIAEAAASLTCHLTLPNLSTAHHRDPLADYASTKPNIPVGPDDTASITFTSGSTGQPKGVRGRHGPLSHFLPWQTEAFNLSAADRFSMLSGLAHDPLQRDIFTALWVGATIYIPDPDQVGTPGYLAGWMQQHEITFAHMTPPMGQILTETADEHTALPQLRYAFFVGDKLTRQDVWQLQRLAPNVTCINSYGSTETQRAVGYYCIPPPEENSSPDRGKAVYPLGKGMPAAQLLVLNAHQGLAGIGEVGEIYLRSPHLAGGYVGDEALTQARFIPNPFSNLPPDRLYRTGDLGRYRPDGLVEFAGRADRQVKIRGFRVEPGEVEHALAQHPNIKQAVVIAREDIPGGPGLVAYIVTEPAAAISPEELRTFLKDRFPDHMVPVAFVPLETMPLTPNGKIHYRALPSPHVSDIKSTETFVGPRNPVEQEVVYLWEQLLQRTPISIYDNFFELGGHSLLVIQVMSRIQAMFKITLPIRILFDHPTVADLALNITHRIANLSPAQRALLEARLSAKLTTNPTGDQLIPRQANDGPLPLSFSQQRIWFLNQLEPDSPVYNLPRAVRIKGPLDVKVLHQALTAIISRHATLRTTFTVIDGEPKQIVSQNWSLELPALDLSQLAQDEQTAAVDRILKEKIIQPFNLTTDLMLRATLLQLDRQDYILLLVLYHIASDGWSTGLLLQELSALYQAFAGGDPSPLPKLPIQYTDFAIWEREQMQGELLQNPLAYWKKQLTGAPAVLELPTDYPRSMEKMQKFVGGRQAIELSKAVQDALNTLSQQKGVTLFMCLLAAFKVLLYRYTAQEHIVIGSPIANRNRVEIEGLIGFFVNTLVLHTDLSGNPPFCDVLARVREVALGAYSHQSLPFEKLVEELKPERNLHINPLFQVMFIFEDEANRTLTLPGLTVSNLPRKIELELFDLTLSMQKTSTGLTGYFTYDTNLFEAATIERMAGHFQTLLESIVADPNRPIAQLPLLPPAERESLLVTWNDTATPRRSDQCIHHLFETQAAQTPQAVAVISGNAQLTYQELNERANQLAHYLKKQGVGPDTLVALYVERSIEAVIGLLGVLKAGGAYVPLDPAYPLARLAFMLDDTQAAILLTQAHLAGKLPEYQAHVLYLDTEWAQQVAHYPNVNPEPATAPEHLTYVLYTSGSTGKPKGVAMPHRSLRNLIEWQLDQSNLTKNAKTLQFASLSFDVSFQEIFSTWCAGGTLVLIPESLRRDISGLLNLIKSEEIARIFLPFIALQQFAEVAVSQQIWPNSLQEIMTAGEQLQMTDAIIQFLDNLDTCTLYNQYGPTESHVATAFTVEKNSNGWPMLPSIGRPIANTQIYILDNHQQPVPVGIPGELHIGGIGLAQGYLNRPELTAEKFIQCRFDNNPPIHLYKTGDLARFLPDGNIEFLGRIDHQVKIRGFRVEPGEIESVLSYHPAIQEVAVVTREDARNTKRLAAYLVLNKDQTTTTSELRHFMQSKVPEYMVPSYFVFLDSLPLTPSGKVNRRELPAPNYIRTQTDQALIVPRNVVETQLIRIWEDLLEVKPIGINDDFFELGGHSLLAVHLFTEIKKTFGTNLPLATLFQGSTVADLAKLIVEQPDQQLWTSLVAIQPQGSKPPIFCVHGGTGDVLWFRELAHHLGKEQPFYGLQSRGLDGCQEPFTRIEDMAAHYISEIRLVQPEGPYLLGGYCFGGEVVYEMARQLQSQGEKVLLLAIISSIPNIGYHKAPWGYRYIASFINNIPHWVTNLQELERQEIFARIRRRARVFKKRINPRSSQLAAEDILENVSELPEHRRRIIELNNSASAAYHPQNYDGQIHVFQPRTPPLFKVETPGLGWDHLVSSDNFTLNIIPGSHQSIFKEPRVQYLAQELNQAVEDALAQQRERSGM